MSTGWAWVFSNGHECKSQVHALAYLREHPYLRVEFSELSMAGVKRTDVTERFAEILRDRAAADSQPEEPTT